MENFLNVPYMAIPEYLKPFLISFKRIGLDAGFETQIATSNEDNSYLRKDGETILKLTFTYHDNYQRYLNLYIGHPIKAMHLMVVAKEPNDFKDLMELGGIVDKVSYMIQHKDLDNMSADYQAKKAISKEHAISFFETTIKGILVTEK
jgi:hypothetical protein